MHNPLHILVCSYLEADQVDRIRAVAGVEVTSVPELLPVPRFPCDHHGARPELDDAGRSRWASLLEAADVCFDIDWDDPAALPARAPRLRWVQASSAGIGQFMVRTGLAASAISFTTAAGVHAAPLAEFALSGVLHFVKDVPDLQERRRARTWDRTAVGSLAGRRLLVVGLGHIGRRVATTFAGLGVEVWGAGRPGQTYDVAALTRTATTDDLAALLPHCDIVVLAVPLTPATDGLIGAAELAALPDRAILVNVARGSVVDEPAMIDALASRRLLGAVLDVTAREPPPGDSPLWELPNVLLCPHSASTLVTENATLVDLFLDNLERFRAGAPLRNLYRAELGY
jgi:glyoxylate/hydroxypyruvate reductase A